jgi:hypothetical protein
MYPLRKIRRGIFIVSAGVIAYTISDAGER